MILKVSSDTHSLKTSKSSFTPVVVRVSQGCIWLTIKQFTLRLTDLLLRHPGCGNALSQDVHGWLWVTDWLSAEPCETHFTVLHTGIRTVYGDRWVGENFQPLWFNQWGLRKEGTGNSPIINESCTLHLSELLNELAWEEKSTFLKKPKSSSKFSLSWVRYLVHRCQEQLFTSYLTGLSIQLHCIQFC